jgi:glutathione S-transferase
MKREQGTAALALMDRHLAERDWFVGNAMSIADIALYAYTHVAGDGGFDLAGFPNVGRWMERLASQPNHMPMNRETPLAMRSPAD